MRDEAVIMQLAGWPVLNLVRSNPFLIDTHFERLIDFLKQEGLHHGCRRNAFGIFDAAMIPEEQHGEIPDLCTRCFKSHDESIATLAPGY